MITHALTDLPDGAVAHRVTKTVTVSLWIPVEEAVDRNIDMLVETFSDRAVQAGGELWTTAKPWTSGSGSSSAV